MSFLFDYIKNSVFTLKKHLLCLTLLFAMFVIGLMCGIILKQPKTILEFYTGNCEKYVEGIFFGGVGGILLDGIVSFLVYTLISLPTICCVWLIGLQGIFLFYKGFVCGILIELLFSLYGLSGGLVFFVVFLPQTIIFTVGFIGFSACVFDCVKQSNSAYISERFRCFIPHFIAYSLYFACAVIFDLVAILLLFRIVFRLV